ncbi:MAG TPA: acetyltransferase [Clostridiaceae bacterium]|nr:acetyltransferase [Clostridiaceae bacterium]
MSKVIIIGASGHGRVIADIVRASGDEVLGFLDDDLSLTNILGSVADSKKYPNLEFIIGIGNAEIREKISRLPLKWYTAIHPTAVISPTAVIGEGTVIMANSVINNGASVGRHCILNTASVVEHDSILFDYVHVSVGAKLGGTVSIGKRTWVGIGAVVSNNIFICGDCIIGAGSVVVKDINIPGTYFGIPAKLHIKE